MPEALALAADTFVLSGRAGVPAELVDQARVDARSVGYAQGWSQGLRDASEAQAEVQASARTEALRLAETNAQRWESALQAVQAAAGRLDQTVVQLTDEISDKILAAAVELAQTLIGQELRDPTVSASAALSRVLRVAPENEPVTVWLSSQDYQTLTGTGGTELIAAIDATGAGRITLECDPALTIGDATARSAATSIDARLTEAVARLREYTA
ncbi:MAG: flagellar assembly protein FliH [Actinomycetota bacterium]|nr:flagellar assembly protein FliH [Actinomycetota bacterium]